MSDGSLKGYCVVSALFLAPSLVYLGSLPAPERAETKAIAAPMATRTSNPERRYVMPLTEDLRFWQQPIRVSAAAQAPAP